MKKPKPTEKQRRACKATIDYAATRCRYCTAPQSNAEAAQRLGKSLMLLGCALPFALIAIVFLVVIFSSLPKQ